MLLPVDSGTNCYDQYPSSLRVVPEVNKGYTDVVKKTCKCGEYITLDMANYKTLPACCKGKVTETHQYYCKIGDK